MHLRGQSFNLKDIKVIGDELKELCPDSLWKPLVQGSTPVRLRLATVPTNVTDSGEISISELLELVDNETAGSSDLSVNCDSEEA